MTPIKFPEHNIVYAKDQPEYLPLPAHLNRSKDGAVTSCWQLSFRERLKLLFTGKLWVQLLSFHGPLTPSYFTVDKTDVFPTIAPETVGEDTASLN